MLTDLPRRLLRSPSAAANVLSVASRMPLVLRVTLRTGRAWAASMKPRMSLWMVGLPAGEHHHLRLTLRSDERVQHPLALLQRDRIPVGLVTGIGETDRAVQVAVRVHLDNAQAGMLLVLRAQPAI